MQRAFAVVLGALMAVVGAEVPAVLAHFFSPGDCSPRPALELLMQQGLCYALPTGVDGFALCGAADSGGGSVTSYPAGSGCGGAAVATVPFLDGECLAGGAVVGAVFNCSGGSAPLSPALPLAAGTAAVLAHSNAAQVSRVRALIEGLSLEIATPDEARQMLNLKGANAVNF